MRKKGWRNFAFMGLFINSHGFTLINALLRIFIISITLPILVFFFAKLKVISNEENLSIQQLFFILQNELYVAKDVYHIGDQLFYTLNNDELAMIEMYQDTIRRRIDYRGHEIYARNIKNLSFEQLNYGIYVTITTTEGDIYERVLIFNK